MTAHERAYRIGVRAYPPDYRAARGEEIVTTLMESHADRHLSVAREFVALVVDGFRRRFGVRAVSGVAAWRSGALLAAGILAFLTTAVALLGVIQEHRNPTIGGTITPWFALFAATAIATLVAVVFGLRRVATAAAAAGLATQVFEFVRAPEAGYGSGSHYLVYSWSNASSLPREPLHWLVPSLLLLVLIVLGRPARRRATVAAPLAAGLLIAAFGVAVETSHAWGGFVALLPALGVFALISLVIVSVDPRPAIASVPLMLAVLPMAWTYVVGDSTTPASHGLLLLVALPLLAAFFAVAASRVTRRRPPLTPGASD